MFEAGVMWFGGLRSACFVSGMEPLICGEWWGEFGLSVFEGARFGWVVRAVLAGGVFGGVVGVLVWVVVGCEWAGWSSVVGVGGGCGVGGWRGGFRPVLFVAFG